MISDVLVTPLKIIAVPDGDVLHGMKRSDQTYSGFGEAYFSTIQMGTIKAWKRHRKMTLNIIVPIGGIKFVIYDDRESSLSGGSFQEVVLSRGNYSRLTVPPMLWMGFAGIEDGENMLLNIADIPHDPAEVDRLNVEDIQFDWCTDE